MTITRFDDPDQGAPVRVRRVLLGNNVHKQQHSTENAQCPRADEMNCAPVEFWHDKAAEQKASTLGYVHKAPAQVNVGNAEVFVDDHVEAKNELHLQHQEKQLYEPANILLGQK